ncbi:uncharacterized protein [Montipora foliosa]
MKNSTLLLFVMMALASEHSENSKHSEPWCKDFTEDDFKKLKKDGDGARCVDLAKFQEYMKKYEGSKDKTVRKMIVKHYLAGDDTNGDGCVDKEEFENTTLSTICKNLSQGKTFE